MEASNPEDSVKAISNNEPKTSFKLHILPLDKYFTTKKLIKFLSSLSVQFVKAKKVVGCEFAIVSFENQAQKDLAKTVLEKQTLNGASLQVTEGKRKNEGQDSTTNTKRRKQDAPKEPQSIQDVVTPLWNVPYDQQLKLKHQNIIKVFRQLMQRLRKDSKYCIPSWMTNHPKEFCEFQGVLPSPITTSYRNKVAFTVGLDKDGKPCIGHAMGRTGNGVTTVADPTLCDNISETTKSIRNALQQHVEHSTLSPYNKISHEGFWREITIKNYTTGETMVIIQVSCKEPELLQREKQALIEWVKSQDKVTSLYIQNNTAFSDAADAPYEHLHGAEFVHEQIAGLKFRVSPAAFFQVNTPATEVLYGKVKEWCQTSPDLTVLDICCGTGTIGLTIANQVKKVIGVEMCAEAVRDAQENAIQNGITNVEYIVGKAEDVLATRLKQITGSNTPCIAIIDPPRAGLHSKTVHAIRGCECIQYLIFVSCDPHGMIDTSVGLCRSESNNMKGAPFKPVKSVAVDLFPSTENVELVTLFCREV